MVPEDEHNYNYDGFFEMNSVKIDTEGTDIQKNNLL